MSGAQAPAPLTPLRDYGLLIIAPGRCVAIMAQGGTTDYQPITLMDGQPVFDQAKRDQDQIVRAVNAHNDLIEALQCAIDYKELPTGIFVARYGVNHYWSEVVAKAKAALSKARGE